MTLFTKPTTKETIVDEIETINQPLPISLKYMVWVLL